MKLKIFTANGQKIRAHSAACSLAFKQRGESDGGNGNYALRSIAENFCAHCGPDTLQAVLVPEPTLVEPTLVEPTLTIVERAPSDEAALLLSHDSHNPQCPCPGCSGGRKARGGVATAFWKVPYNIREAFPATA